jgi:hypothetical protein
MQSSEFNDLSIQANGVEFQTRIGIFLPAVSSNPRASNYSNRSRSPTV